MIIAFYFLIMRPQRKRQQQQQDMMSTLEPGTRVVTTTGIYATVVAVGAKQVVLETAPGTQVTMLKQAVGRIVSDDEEDAELAGYRGSAPAAAEPQDESHELPEYAPQSTDSADDSSDGDSATGGSATGLAGGAPIHEYTPGSSPDWTDPQHQTSPWPAAAGSEPASAEDQSSAEEHEGESNDAEDGETSSPSSEQDRTSDR